MCTQAFLITVALASRPTALNRIGREPNLVRQSAMFLPESVHKIKCIRYLGSFDVEFQNFLFWDRNYATFQQLEGRFWVEGIKCIQKPSKQNYKQPQ